MKLAITKITLLLALLCAICSSKAKASHIAALDMYVTYIGAGQDGCSGTTEYRYEVTLIIHTACEPSSFDIGTTPPAPVFWGSTNAIASNGPAGNSGQVPMNLIANLGGDNTKPDIVHVLCPQYNNSNSCINVANQNLPGYKRWTYRGQIVVPSPQTDWTFKYTQPCCRNQIINLQTNSSSYIQVVLNNLNKYNNSSARFNGNPLPYICNQTRTEYLNKAFSPDKDVVRVRSVISRQTEAMPDVFTGIYTYANPIGSTEGYRVDPISGTAYFRAATPGNYVLAFEAIETDKLSGGFLSSIRRDAQVKVFDCTAPPPRIDSIPGDLFSTIPAISNATIVENCKDTGYYIYGCPGSDISFEVNAIPDFRDDPTNVNNIIYLRANNAEISATANFTVTGNGTNKTKGVFSWTPTVDDYGDYALIVTAVDTTCDLDQPIVLLKERVFNIRIARGLDAGDDLTVCQYNGKPVQLFVKGAECLKLQWSNLDGSVAKALAPRTDTVNPVDTLIKPIVDHSFVVFSSDLVGACKAKDTVQVLIDRLNTVSVVPKTPYVLCRPDYLQLDAVTTGPRPLTNMPCGTGNPVTCKPEDLVSFPIFGSPSYGKNVQYDTLGTTTPTFPNFEVRTSKQQYYISKGDLWAMGLRSSTIRSISMEIIKNNEPTHPYDNFTISMKCTGRDSLSKQLGFENFMTQVYSSTTPVLFGAGVKEFVLTQPYTWDTTQNLIIEICYANNTYIPDCSQASGTAPFLRFVPTERATTLFLKRFYTTPNVCGVITHDSIQTKASRPLFVFKVCEPTDVPFVFRWSGLDPTGKDSTVQFLSDSTIQQPLAYVPKSITYYVETKGRSSCIVKDSIAIYVPEHDYKLIPKDTTICFGETANMRVNTGFDFKWYEYVNGQYIPAKSVTCFNCREVELKPNVTTTYKVVVYDSVWCIDTITTTITVLPLPDIKIITNDTILKYGQSIQLLASGARMYNWSPVAALNNANIAYPIARPTESTQFVAGGIGANGCRAFDTLNISVDTRDNLFVPSGFSPNGDGKNDLFRIANLSFQRVVEFRVFNRWGQEIYNSNTNNGWDGSWKGQPQDVGTYNYQIRIALPDGFVESYKGEVSLIR